jgi:hypothetical protein
VVPVGKAGPFEEPPAILLATIAHHRRGLDQSEAGSGGDVFQTVQDLSSNTLPPMPIGHANLLEDCLSCAAVGQQPEADEFFAPPGPYDPAVSVLAAPRRFFRAPTAAREGVISHPLDIRRPAVTEPTRPHRCRRRLKTEQ